MASIKFSQRRQSMTRLLRRQLRRKAFLAKWSKLDWSKTNLDLADELGLSRERIRQIRLKVGAPKLPHPHRLRKTTAALQWAKDNLDQLKGLTAAELWRKHGINLRWRRGPLYQFLKPFLRNGILFKKHRWDLMNFKLPNRDLERIWRLPRYMVTAYRFRNRRPQPTWRSRRGCGPTQLIGRGQLQAYLRAVKAEEQNAARCFARA